MNQKKPYKTDWTPQFLHQFDVASTGKTYRVTKGTWVSVTRRPGLLPGKYEIIYAERTGDGTLLITADGPLSRGADRRRKTLRETDIKTVHVKTRPRG